MKNKAVLIKCLVMLVLVMFVCADMVIVSDAERRDYWAYIGIRLLFIILLGWAFFVKKLQWLAWGLVVACGFGVRYVNGVVPSVKIESWRYFCDDMSMDYDVKSGKCVAREL